MKPSFDQHNAFLAREPLPSVRFEHNDFVRVASGEHAGINGSIVSVEVLGDDPVYLVELESNQDALVPQSRLSTASA